jgi:hypothetical protein
MIKMIKGDVIAFVSIFSEPRHVKVICSRTSSYRTREAQLLLWFWQHFAMCPCHICTNCECACFSYEAELCEVRDQILVIF